MTTTSSPLDKVKWVICGAPAMAVATAPTSALATIASAAKVVRGLSKTVSYQRSHSPQPRGRTRHGTGRGRRGEARTGTPCGGAGRRCLASGSRGAVFDRRCLAFCLLRSKSIGLGRRRCLITSRRRGQAVPSRLAGEGPSLPLIAKRRKDVTEKALGAQFRGPHRPRAFIRILRTSGVGAGSGGDLAAVELGAGNRASLRFHGFGRSPVGQLFLGGLDLALLRIGVLGPGRIGRDGGFALGRRQVAARRHHQWRTFAVIDAFSVPAQAQVLEELAHELGVERYVLVVGRALRESASARRQCDCQRDCCGGSDASPPVRISVPHGYPLKV